MKYFYIGTAILLLLFASALLLEQRVAAHAAETASLLQAAVDELDADDFSAAHARSDAAATHWETQNALLRALLGHDVLDEITEGFCRLHAYAVESEQAEYRSQCQALLFRLHHIAERDFAFWYNFLVFALDPSPPYAV